MLWFQLLYPWGVSWGFWCLLKVILFLLEILLFYWLIKFLLPFCFGGQLWAEISVLSDEGWFVDFLLRRVDISFWSLPVLPWDDWLFPFALLGTSLARGVWFAVFPVSVPRILHFWHCFLCLVWVLCSLTSTLQRSTFRAFPTIQFFLPGYRSLSCWNTYFRSFWSAVDCLLRTSLTWLSFTSRSTCF